MARRKVLFLVTEDWYFWSHRLPAARAAREAGFAVHVAAREGEHGARIRGEGFDFHPLGLKRGSLSPLSEAAALLELIRLYLALRPEVAHHVALKPVIYGSIAARVAGVPAVVNAMAGLGAVFIAGGARAAAVKAAFRLALPKTGTRMIFQNEDDRCVFVDAGIAPKERTTLIRGSGVDLEAFKPAEEPAGPPLVVLPARMLWDKGVGEFVEAARRLRARKSPARMALVGPRDPDNPAAISQAQLDDWGKEGIVELMGPRADMPAVLASAAIVCLPSYREGLPKALLEAAAAGRPMIAADVPGCREITRHGETGLLVKARDAGALAEAIEKLAADKPERARMGRRAREVAQAEFSDAEVAKRTLALYRELLTEAGLP
jgi:glycosyltransferase involved in cell wall biosynthesis